MTPRIRIVSFAIGIFCLFTLANCGSDDSTVASSTNLSSYFPSNLAVSSLTEQSSGSAALNLNSVGAFDSSSTDTISAKKEKLETLASGPASCAVNIELTSEGNAPCYGPNVTFANHPDGAPPAGALPGGDLGIFVEAMSSGEACAAAQLNSRMRGVGSKVDTGMFAMASLFCAAGKAGLAAPPVGSSLDLTANMSGLVSINGTAVTVTSASLSRDADATDGRPVYISSYAATQGDFTYEIRLKHVPEETDLNSFRGKLSVAIRTDDTNKQGNCAASTEDGDTEGLSIAYNQESASQITYELKSAQYCGNDSVPWVSSSDYTVDFSKKVSGSATGWANNANYLLAAGDPSANSGTVLYSWQAGHGDSDTRTLNVEINAGTPLTGTAFFGFGPEISVATGRGSINKMICNWAGPGNSHAGIAKAQKQVLSLSSGQFTASSSNIMYDAVNSCEDAGTFQVDATIEGTPVSRVGSATTEDLVPVSEISTTITAPTVPVNVDAP